MARSRLPGIAIVLSTGSGHRRHISGPERHINDLTRAPSAVNYRAGSCLLRPGQTPRDMDTDVVGAEKLNK